MPQDSTFRHQEKHKSINNKKYKDPIRNYFKMMKNALVYIIIMIKIKIDN